MGRTAFVALYFLSASFIATGQATQYTWFYRVYFKDKGANAVSGYTAAGLLSERAIARRLKASIPVPDLRDIPVKKSYLDEIAAMGLVLHSTSKWMNTGLFKSTSAIDMQSLLSLGFVSAVKVVKDPVTKGIFNRKLDVYAGQAALPPFDRPITMVNGYSLLDNGFTGKNILIGVLDGGFTGTDIAGSLSDLRSRNGIVDTYDFVHKNKLVYNSATHGTAVLSILAGKIPGEIQGTSPDADYLLLKTEDVNSEFPCEEDFWVAGAEYADSAGVDIISSSLGYFAFDDSTLNYKQSDLDGNTAFITRAADIAASKGILVVNSAGNERENDWKYIIFPADGDSVLAVGAVDGNKLISAFSSAGPSSDKRIKPDNAAMGVSVAVQTGSNSPGRGNGTSFSCPVLSGMAACLKQAVPEASDMDIIKALHSSGDRFSSPDSLYGYGIPDMAKAISYLQDLFIKIPDGEAVLSPNPNTGSFDLTFKQPPGDFSIEIFSISGTMIMKREYSGYSSRRLFIDDLQNAAQGLYIIRINRAGSRPITVRFVKLNSAR